MIWMDSRARQLIISETQQNQEMKKDGENTACIHDSCLLKQCGEQIVQQHRER